MSKIIGLKPLEFLHVLDLNTNVTRVEKGPCTVVLQSNEFSVGGPFPLVCIPPGHYCTVCDPCSNFSKEKECQILHGQRDIRFHGEPFALFPGEYLQGAEEFAYTSSKYESALKPLPVVQPECAIRLEARETHTDGGVKRTAGDHWQLEGPLTYIPSPYTDILEIVAPCIITNGQAIRLRAVQDTKDKNGKKRVTGEEWLETAEGAYLPGVYEEVVQVERILVLTETRAVHLIATMNVTDFQGIKRQAGEEWLVTHKETEQLVPAIGVEVMKDIKRTVLMKGQYCVVVDPADSEGRLQRGCREVRKGHTSFFLHPGETLLAGIQSAFILGSNEALVLQAQQDFTDKSEGHEIEREAGERWMVHGPVDYIPQVEVDVIESRKAISLSDNEGVYVRNTQTGNVRAIMGPRSYMLKEYEILWKKELPQLVETLLSKGGGLGSDAIRKMAYFEQCIDPQLAKGRDQTRVVTYRCPGNTACQVYNYRDKKTRVVLGPNMVILGPYENFNVLSLSAGKPKKPNAMQSLCLMLGPDFITDIIQVETSDHARLQIQLAFNNYFEVDFSNEENINRIFAIPDFIGYASKHVGSRIRAAVAQISFDEFHRHSTQVVQHAVFRIGTDGEQQKTLTFPANNLVISSVDVQSIEPVDMKMRDSLMKSVQMAIEIATSSIEASAAHEASRLEQKARGSLERQRLSDESAAERERAKLLVLQAQAAAVESTGQAVAEARANAERAAIQGQSQIQASKLKAIAADIEHQAKLEIFNKQREAKLNHAKEMAAVEIEKEREMKNTEVSKFTSMVDTLGKDTIAAIANSAPQQQVSLLKGLGIETTLITDGKNPINLLTTATGLVGQ